MWAYFKKNMSPHSLSEQEVKSSLSWLIQDGIAAQLMESLTAGPILVALALSVGASNALIGYLVALPFLANLAQFPAAYLVDKYHVRKWLAIPVSMTGRMCIPLIACLAFFPETKGAAIWLALLYTGRYVGASFAGAPWNSWMKDLIPSQILGQFFSKRLKWVMAASLCATLSSAFFLNLWPYDKNDFYGILISIAAIIAFYSGYIYYRIQEPSMEAPPLLQENFFNRIKKVFQDKNFTKLMLFLGSWNFSINLAVPFFTVFILQGLELSLSFVLILTTLTQVVSVLVMGTWGKISDTLSNKSILQVSAPIYILCIFLFLFTGTPDKHFLTIPLLILIYALMGIAQAGITLASNNIALKLAPKGSAAIYLSVNGTLNAAMAGTAPILGGLFADFFTYKELSLNLIWSTATDFKDFTLFYMHHWDFFFLFAAILAIGSLTFLKRIREEGEVTEKVVISSFLSDFSKSLNASYLLPYKIFLFLSRKKYKEKIEKEKQK